MCDCGAIRIVFANSLKSGKSKSCGCYGTERHTEVCENNFKTHGDSKSRLYKIYCGIKKRCYNPHAYNYKNYGARGIAMCDEWLNDWITFKDWSLKNGYNDSLTIDRIDVNGNYSPLNCRWVTCVAQANNKRTSRRVTYQGETHTLAEWARILDIPYKMLHKKIQRGMTLSEIIAS